MLFKSTLSVPHGGIFVLFAVENLIGYIIAIAVGTVVTAFLVGTLKKPLQEIETERNVKNEKYNRSSSI